MTNKFSTLAIACVFVTLAACGGNDKNVGGGSAPPPPQTGIGAGGGTATGPNGSQVFIPAGALAGNIDIVVSQSSAGSPALPAGFTTVGSMFAFTPHGTTFALPVTITLPYEPSLLPSGAAPALYKTNALSQWEPVAGATFGTNNVTATITSFSHAQVLIPPLIRSEPTRFWSLRGYPGHGGELTSFGEDTQVGGVLEEVVEFGKSLNDIDIIGLTETVPAGGKAHGYVFGTESGSTYGAYAEAPFARIGGSELIGGVAHLTQFQSFIKRSADASVKFTLSKTLLSVWDFNQFSRGVGYDDTDITAEVQFDVRAYTTSNIEFFSTGGGATAKGTFAALDHDVWNREGAVTPLWSEGNFKITNRPFTVAEFGACVGNLLEMQLNAPRTFTVDLSAIDIGEEFTLRSEVIASAENRRGGGAAGDCEGSAAFAYLRDPAEIGGTTIEFSGLEPTNRPLLTPPVATPVVPASCVARPDPAGTLQFSAAGFEVGEHAAATPSVRVTRVGGTSGAVTATFTTSAGTAIAGTDYTPVDSTVHFADGDDAPRVVEIPIVADALDEPNESVNLTLSQPGGCAVLGDQTTAVLTIVDDDLPPATGLPGALDAGFGNSGKASLTAFGGDRSTMTIQADGKIVMVGGTFTDFVLARFNADGTLDATFDADGRVTTDLISGEPEEALAVTIQPDGKIVVAGYTGTAGPGGAVQFALARYNPDGSLDVGFGTQGKVMSGVTGTAYALAIQPDGKLLVAGETPRPDTSDFSDFMVARFNTNGTLDTTFASAGLAVTDIGAGTNTARNIALQPNGAFVVGGEPFGIFIGSDHTDLVRYDANGNLDGSFGTGGKLTLSGARLGEGLALAPDGKLILAGSILAGSAPTAVSQFLVRRLNADGSIDATFGGTGSVTTAFTDRGDAAFAVAFQRDGKLLVAGSSSIQTNSNFAVARYLVDGSLDTTFANAGKQTVDFFGASDIAESVVVQSDGKIVVGGLARNQVDGYGLARINP